METFGEEKSKPRKTTPQKELDVPTTVGGVQREFFNERDKVTSEEEVTDENSNTDLENITEGESGGTTNSDTNSDLTAEANSEE